MQKQENLEITWGLIVKFNLIRVKFFLSPVFEERAFSSFAFVIDMLKKVSLNVNDGV